MKSFDGSHRINVATDLHPHTMDDASVVISECPSQHPYNSPSPRIILLSADMMQDVIIPQTQASFPHAVDEDSARERLAEHPCQEYAAKKARSGYDDILDIVDHEIDFYAGVTFYDYEVRYFDNDDLHQSIESEYDYPRAVDDDEDSYLRDPDLHMIFEQSIFSGQQAEWDRFKMVDLEEMTNAEYFDALELSELADVPVSSEEEEDSDLEVGDTPGLPSKRRVRQRSAGGSWVSLYNGFSSGASVDEQGPPFQNERIPHHSVDELQRKSLDVR